MKAPATFPDDIVCRRCGKHSTWVTTDAARAHGWCVGWTPQQPTYCDECCGSQPKKRATSTTQPYDVPLF